ncbi:FAD-binding oxidoreductase [Patescibacteria group bacterium]|nr:FAD-binding oxidoreductase [Patescibacteria group bacterium]
MISKHTGEIVRKDIINNKYILLDIQSSKNLEYKSGQYVSLFIKDKIQRSFSVYSPDNSQILSLGIKIEENGIGSGAILHDYKIGDKIDFLGPVGNFYYKEDQSDKLVFIATGIGIIPIKGIIDNLMILRPNKEIYLFWGVRTDDDILFEFKNYNIKYIQVVSRPTDNIQNVGYVQNYINKDTVHIDKNTSIYICGAPENVDTIKYHIKDNFVIDFNKIYTEKF